MECMLKIVFNMFQFMTDGMMIREIMADPLLKKYRYAFNGNTPVIFLLLNVRVSVLFQLGKSMVFGAELEKIKSEC